MAEICCSTYHSKVGQLKIGVYKDSICLCDWQFRRMRRKLDGQLSLRLKAEMGYRRHSLQDLLIEQLEEYLKGNRKVFDVPLTMVGTDFQKQVWTKLRTIPFGQSYSYLELANKLEHPKAVRAVAAANAANILAIIVPCHRIIGNQGQLVGYAGGVEVKKRLLQLENAYPFNQPTLF